MQIVIQCHQAKEQKKKRQSTALSNKIKEKLIRNQIFIFFRHPICFFFNCMHAWIPRNQFQMKHTKEIKL